MIAKILQNNRIHYFIHWLAILFGRQSKSEMKIDSKTIKTIKNYNDINKYIRSYGDDSHPFIPLINSLIADFQIKLNYLEARNVEYKTYCSLGIVSLLKLHFFKLAQIIITEHVLVDELTVNVKSVYDRFSNIEKSLNSIKNENEYYDTAVLKMFCVLFKGAFCQDLRHIDKVIQRKEPLYYKSKEVADILIESFRCSLVILNNYQVPCHLMSNKSCDISPSIPHVACATIAKRVVLIPISKEHFDDPVLIVRVMGELKRFDTRDVLLFIDFSRIDEYVKYNNEIPKVPVNRLTMKFLRFIKQFKVYYITNYENVDFGSYQLPDEVTLDSIIEITLARRYWDKFRERYPVSKYEAVAKEINDICVNRF